MKIRLWTCAVVVFSMMMVDGLARESKTGKEYIYQGETFTVTKLDACEMEVVGKGLTAKISIHTATNRYRASLHGWGSDYSSLKEALNGACKRILENASRPSPKELCEGMDDFYKLLPKESQDSKEK